MASFASTSSSTLNQALDFHLNPVEREQFDFFKNHEGNLEKYASAMFAGWQKRYWKIRCNRDFLLSYQKDEDSSNKTKGVLKIEHIKEVTKEGDRK